MKSVILLTAFLVATQALPTTDLQETEWKNFKVNYGKSYKSKNEEIIRKETFIQNLRKFEEHNQKYAAGLVSYAMGVNKFADMTSDEFLQTLTPINVNEAPEGQRFVPSSDVPIPASLDWREKGAVTPVKDQGDCGSCYAFSATGAIEGQLFLKFNKTVSLSEQQLIDCTYGDDKWHNSGCKGGLVTLCFIYAKGITTEESYPYEGKLDKCRYDPKNTVEGRVVGYIRLGKDNETQLLDVVGSSGPVSILLNAQLLPHYKEGILDGTCDTEELNHAVLLVGYGITDDGKEYWIVKNSWGVGYGEEGYVRLIRNKNLCGLARDATFPIVLKKK